jgi:hypothetical protein
VNEDSERYVRRGPQGATGETGQRGEAGVGGKTRHAIVYLFVLAMMLAATSILFTVVYVGYQHRQHQANLKRQDAIAAAAQAKAAVPVCKALLHLAEIKGSHGDSGATYGQNLEAAFQQVYRATGCPQIMKTAR